MRAALGVLVIFSFGCVTPRTTVTTTTVQRVVFSTMPSSSAALAGASGVGLRLNALTATPVATRSDGAVSFPLFQPDLGVIVKLGKASYMGGRVGIAVPDFGAQSPMGVIAAPRNAAAFDLSFGGGHDFQFTPLLGLSVSGEVGIAGLTLTKTIRGSVSELQALPVIRGTVGFFAQPGDFRFYAGGTVGTSVSNDALGTNTETCRITCTSTETGAMDVIAVGMVGGGARWQASPLFSIALEGWVPLSENLRFPPMLSLALRLGDFATKPAPRPVQLPPPPPMPAPEVTPDPEQAPVQL